MTPLTQNPTVVIRLDSNGQNIISVASNISADLKVVLTEGWASFEDEAANKPFSDTRTLQPVQVMSMAASKARYA
jgi:hypothetical protein